jgi:prolyl oligopeptidase
MKKKTILIICILLNCLNTVIGQELYSKKLENLQTDKNIKSEDEKLDLLYQILFDYQLEVYPENGIFLGKPSDNSRWTDYSKEAITLHKKDNDLAITALAGINRNNLNNANKLNYDLLKNKLDDENKGEQFPSELMPIDQMYGAHHQVIQTITFTNIKNEKDANDLLKRLEKIPALFDQIQILMEEGIKQKITPSKNSLLKVPEQIQNLIADDPTKSEFLTGYRKYTETLSAEKKKAMNDLAIKAITEKVNPALKKLKEYLEKTYIPNSRNTYGLKDLPNGINWYNYNIQQVTTTKLTYTEIHEIGLREVKRIRTEMDSLIKKIGFKGTFEEFGVFLKTDPKFYFETADQLLDAYRVIAKKIDPQLPTLFGKLPRLPYGVMAVPSYSEKSQPTAYYNQGSIESGRAGNFYANTYNLKTRPKWAMEALTAHEAVPGHHLQIALGQELENVPEIRKISSYTAFVEGWGLYSESLGSEIGLYKDPYSKYGQLTYEIWRAIRLVVDTGIHGLGWSRQQAIDYFKANSSISENDITVEVDRYITWPGQALAYKIGELKIKELRKKATLELGDKFDVRRFHDAVLENGAVPLNILENHINEWIASVKNKSK